MKRLLVSALGVFVSAWLLSAAQVHASAVRTLSTGIGIEGRTPHPDYSTLLVFEKAKGALLADVDVRIRNNRGKTVLNTESIGPWLFVALPQGRYKVQATSKNGKTEKALLTVPAKGQMRVNIKW